MIVRSVRRSSGSDLYCSGSSVVAVYRVFRALVLFVVCQAQMLHVHCPGLDLLDPQLPSARMVTVSGNW